MSKLVGACHLSAITVYWPLLKFLILQVKCKLTSHNNEPPRQHKKNTSFSPNSIIFNIYLGGFFFQVLKYNFQNSYLTSCLGKNQNEIFLKIFYFVHIFFICI